MTSEMLVLSFILAALLAYLVYRIVRAKTIKKREQLIKDYVFPEKILQSVKARYPHLEESQLEQVQRGLRDYFHVCNIAGKQMVAMPSQVVDIAWHEFILFTREYDRFCRQALGRFLHHTPAEAMISKTQAQKGIKIAWRLACQRSNIKPKRPATLPPLFAIDSDLDISDGFNYSIDCMSSALDNDGTEFCASHIGCGSGCTSGCGGDSSGCGGCGGD